MKILDVKVDQITMDQVLIKVGGWLKNGKGKHYITTPNLEIIRDAQNNAEFKKALNNADLAIPDSSRLTWLLKLSTEKNFLKRVGIFLEGVFPGGVKYQDGNEEVIQFEVVAGVDLMEALCEMASEKAFTIGLLGAAPGVAEKTRECLIKKYSKLTVNYALTGTVIPAKAGIHTNKDLWIPDQVRDDKVDILFVAFGHGKQEKWILENLPNIPVKVTMGVGGAFDYISGQVPRAPKWMRSLGMEWLFRLIVQPWRIKRQVKLIGFQFKLLLSGQSMKRPLNTLTK